MWLHVTLKMAHMKDRQKLQPRQKLSKSHNIVFKVKMCEIAEAVGILEERVQNILHEELGMRKLCTRWVPHLLNADQKHMC